MFIRSREAAKECSPRAQAVGVKCEAHQAPEERKKK